MLYFPRDVTQEEGATSDGIILALSSFSENNQSFAERPISTRDVVNQVDRKFLQDTSCVGDPGLSISVSEQKKCLWK